MDPMLLRNVPRLIYVISVLTASMVISFMVSLSLLFFFEIPPGNRETLVYMLGQLSGFTSSCVLFWVGTSQGSMRKTDIIAQSPPVKE